MVFTIPAIPTQRNKVTFPSQSNMHLEKRLKAAFDPYFEAPLEAWKQFASLCELVKFRKNEIIKPFGQAERYGYFILSGSGGVFL